MDVVPEDCVPRSPKATMWRRPEHLEIESHETYLHSPQLASQLETTCFAFGYWMSEYS